MADMIVKRFQETILATPEWLDGLNASGWWYVMGAMNKWGAQAWEDVPPLRLKHSKTFLHREPKIPADLIEHGFQFLDNRTLVVCLLDLKQTAAHIKNLDETTLTLETCGTLYLPVYDDRALWLRRGKAAEALLRAWQEELEKCDGWLALTRAMHRTQPLTWYLPPIGG